MNIYNIMKYFDKKLSVFLEKSWALLVAILV